jgi:membrane protease YdiL (CAAX protease family)
MIGHVYWLGPIAWYHVAAFGLFVPWLAWRQRTRQKLAGPSRGPRLRRYRSSAFMLLVFGVFSLMAARGQGLDLFPRPVAGPWWSWAAAAAAYGLGVTLMRPRWRAAVRRREPRVHYFMPSTPLERGAWAGVAVLAGVSEEITWRGVQPALVAHLTGSPAAGIVLTALAFGAAHAVQGWKSASAIVGFALVFQGLVWLSGSLLPAMAAHAAYDLTAGLVYARFGREFGYDLPAPPADPQNP